MKKTNRITFEELSEFKKDLKHLLKKYSSLQEDIEKVMKLLNDEPDATPPYSFRIDNLGIKTCVIKIKKIACKSLKGRGVNSGLRLIYAYFKEKQRIVFIELYHKNDKANEDKDRIMKYFK